MKYNQYKYNFYLNASHAIYIGGNRGARHPHTWEISLYVVNIKDTFIMFNKVEKIIEDYLGQYQEKYINDCPIFKSMNPTLENIAHCLLDELQKILNPLNWVIFTMEISETPSRAYIISNVENNIINDVEKRNIAEEILLKSKLYTKSDKKMGITDAIQMTGQESHSTEDAISLYRNEETTMIEEPTEKQVDKKQEISAITEEPAEKESEILAAEEISTEKKQEKIPVTAEEPQLLTDGISNLKKNKQMQAFIAAPKVKIYHKDMGLLKEAARVLKSPDKKSQYKSRELKKAVRRKIRFVKRNLKNLEGMLEDVKPQITLNIKPAKELKQIYQLYLQKSESNRNRVHKSKNRKYIKQSRKS